MQDKMDDVVIDEHVDSDELHQQQQRWSQQSLELEKQDEMQSQQSDEEMDLVRQLLKEKENIEESSDDDDMQQIEKSKADKEAAFFDMIAQREQKDEQRQLRIGKGDAPEILQVGNILEHLQKQQQAAIQRSLQVPRPDQQLFKKLRCIANGDEDDDDGHSMDKPIVIQQDNEESDWDGQEDQNIRAPSMHGSQQQEQPSQKSVDDEDDADDQDRSQVDQGSQDDIIEDVGARENSGQAGAEHDLQQADTAIDTDADLRKRLFSSTQLNSTTHSPNKRLKNDPVQNGTIPCSTAIAQSSGTGLAPQSRPVPVNPSTKGKEIAVLGPTTHDRSFVETANSDDDDMVPPFAMIPSPSELNQKSAGIVIQPKKYVRNKTTAHASSGPTQLDPSGKSEPPSSSAAQQGPFNACRIGGETLGDIRGTAVVEEERGSQLCDRLQELRDQHQVSSVTNAAPANTATNHGTDDQAGPVNTLSDAVQCSLPTAGDGSEEVALSRGAGSQPHGRLERGGEVQADQQMTSAQSSGESDGQEGKQDNKEVELESGKASKGTKGQEGVQWWLQANQKERARDERRDGEPSVELGDFIEQEAVLSDEDDGADVSSDEDEQEQDGNLADLVSKDGQLEVGQELVRDAAHVAWQADADHRDVAKLVRAVREGFRRDINEAQDEADARKRRAAAGGEGGGVEQGEEGWGADNDQEDGGGGEGRGSQLSGGSDAQKGDGEEGDMDARGIDLDGELEEVGRDELDDIVVPGQEYSSEEEEEGQEGMGMGVGGDKGREVKKTKRGSKQSAGSLRFSMPSNFSTVHSMINAPPRASGQDPTGKAQRTANTARGSVNMTTPFKLVPSSIQQLSGKGGRERGQGMAGTSSSSVFSKGSKGSSGGNSNGVRSSMGSGSSYVFKIEGRSNEGAANNIENSAPANFAGILSGSSFGQGGDKSRVMRNAYADKLGDSKLLGLLELSSKGSKKDEQNVLGKIDINKLRM